LLKNVINEILLKKCLALLSKF